MTGTSIERATRSAVRCRVPVSDVGTLGFGTRWTLARAIRLALEFVGPMVAAEAHNPLDNVRRKLEETFGQFELSQTPAPHVGAEEDLVATLTRAIELQPDFRYAYINRANALLSRHPWLALQDFHHVGMYPERTVAKLAAIVLAIGMAVTVTWRRLRRQRRNLT